LKRKEVISNCPVCQHELSITRLHCNNCNIEITGDFNLSRLNYLSKDQLHFVELFLKNQGSIKSVEKEMNISYPTVKKLLNEVLLALGYDVDENMNENKTTIQRQQILDRLANKEISFDEATNLLRNVK
jgi:hypothetical protein